MKNRIATIATAIAICWPGISAATPEAQPAQYTSYPEIIEGVRIYMPSFENNRVLISDLSDFPGLSQQRIFANALLAARQGFEGDSEDFEYVDFSNFKMRIKIEAVDESRNATYRYTLAIQAADEILSFEVFDMTISYRERGVIPRTQRIEKMNPADNERHKNLITGLLFNISSLIKQMAESIAADKAGEVNHWDALAEGNIVNGMNPTEVILLQGIPDSERKTSNRVKWMYGNENVIIFTDGAVTKVI